MGLIKKTYKHPDTHPSSMITNDANRRFITADESIVISQLKDDSASGWMTATLLNGWTTKFDRALRFRKVGNMLHISGGVGGGTTGDGTSVFFLPSGFRPSRTIVAFVGSGGNNSQINGNALINRLVINTTGSVTLSYNYSPEGWMIDIVVPL